MKIQPRQIETFTKAPKKEARVILIYGPNTGLIREYADNIGKTIVSDLKDPFNVSNIDASTIINDPAIIEAEAKSFSMMGGSKFIKITDGTDGITPYIKSYLESPSSENLIVITAGELPARSSLRKICEKLDNAASIACYEDEQRNIPAIIREMLSAEKLRASIDAINFLSANISGDREKIRSEIEKLIIYKGDDKSEITLEEANDCCGTLGSNKIDELINAMTSKRSDTVIKTYNNLISEGTSIIMIIRIIQSHFKKLYLAKLKMDQGLNTEMAIKSITPPVFFKQKPYFVAQLNKYNSKTIESILSKLCELEKMTKQSNMPIETITGQTIVGISMK